VQRLAQGKGRLFPRPGTQKLYDGGRTQRGTSTTIPGRPAHPFRPILAQPILLEQPFDEVGIDDEGIGKETAEEAASS